MLPERDIIHILHFVEQERIQGIGEETIQKKEKVLLMLYAYIGKPVITMTTKDIEKFLATNEHRASFNRKRRYCEQFFNYLLEKGLVLSNPVIEVDTIPEKESKPHGVFTMEEVKRLLSAPSQSPVGKRDRAILEVLYSSGIRISECVNLDCSDIDFRNYELLVSQAKNEKERIVPIGSEALEYLNEYLSVRSRFVDYEREYKLCS